MSTLISGAATILAQKSSTIHWLLSMQTKSLFGPVNFPVMARVGSAGLWR
jgi:hypothetical protein